jgi:hypothetical protein
LLRAGAERIRQREGAPALLEAEGEREPRRGDGQDEREPELDPRQAGELDRREVRPDDAPLWSMSVTFAPGPMRAATRCATAVGDVPSVWIMNVPTASVPVAVAT